MEQVAEALKKIYTPGEIWAFRMRILNRIRDEVNSPNISAMDIEDVLRAIISIYG